LVKAETSPDTSSPPPNAKLATVRESAKHIFNPSSQE